MTRPAIGARVRVLGNTGIPGIAGQCGNVFAHHEDGVAFRVFLDLGGYLLCDPKNVEQLHPQPARLIGSAS